MDLKVYKAVKVCLNNLQYETQYRLAKQESGIQ